MKVMTRMDHPGFILLEAKAFDEEGKALVGPINEWGRDKQSDIFFVGGACVQPEKLSPVAEPEDFDEFWQGCSHSYTMKPYMSFTISPEGIREVGLKEK